MILRLLTWLFGGLTGFAALLLHEPFAEWIEPCPPSGFYEDGAECVPSLAGLVLIVPALLCLGFVILLRVLRARGQQNEARTGMEKLS